MKNKIITFLLLILIIFIFNISFEKYEKKNIDIDIVYTWVQSSDPERYTYLSKLNKKDTNLSKFRYKNSEELKYSLRSVEKYCPWVRKIYIVVKDGQIPPFINFNNPKIKLVNHSEIMPYTALPTFNSIAIETCIHKIQGLSDIYLYFNDDFFVNDYISLKEIFNGKPMINIKYPLYFDNNLEYKMDENFDFTKNYNNTIYIANKLLNMKTKIKLPHTPSVCYKPWEIEIENFLKNTKYKNTNLWDYNVHSKFRKNDNIALNNGFRTMYYIKKDCDKNYWGDHTYVMKNKNNCKLKIKKSKMFSINQIDDGCDEIFKETMEKLYDKKSSFEL
jgi:hypothetical protein